MGDSFFSYIQKLEIIAIFSGYPLVYAIVVVLSGYIKRATRFKYTVTSMLPFSYALTGVLFLGLQLRKLYPDYSVNNINTEIQNPFLTIWGILAIVFFLPFLRKRIVLSLLHSLVFFFLVIKDILLYLISSNTDQYAVRNAMNVYSNSLILNLAILVFVLMAISIFRFFKKRSANTFR